ncbi:MAG: hypothetical protein P8N72_07140 [Flavimaricola sp.]|nr:hypothetical protein [Flavimaricola sp.]
MAIKARPKTEGEARFSAKITSVIWPVKSGPSAKGIDRSNAPSRNRPGTHRHKCFGLLCGSFLVSIGTAYRMPPRPALDKRVSLGGVPLFLYLEGQRGRLPPKSGREAKMFIRCAFFKGTIKTGMEEAFHAHWRENLVPLWGAFPNLLELRVLCEVESDDADSPFPLVMAMKFASRDHIQEALASPTRWASKETSKKLLEMFDGHVIHTVFAADQFDPTA